MRTVCAAVVGIVLLVSGCEPFRTTVLRTKAAEPWTGAVRIVAVADARGEQVGVVRVEGVNREVPDVMAEFADEVAQLGGNLGVVEKVETTNEVLYRTLSGPSFCDGAKVNRPCYGASPMYAREDRVVTVVGRAYRAK